MVLHLHVGPGGSAGRHRGLPAVKAALIKERRNSETAAAGDGGGRRETGDVIGERALGLHSDGEIGGAASAPAPPLTDLICCDSPAAGSVWPPSGTRGPGGPGQRAADTFEPGANQTGQGLLTERVDPERGCATTRSDLWEIIVSTGPGQTSYPGQRHCIFLVPVTKRHSVRAAAVAAAGGGGGGGGAGGGGPFPSPTSQDQDQDLDLARLVGIGPRVRPHEAALWASGVPPAGRPSFQIRFHLQPATTPAEPPTPCIFPPLLSWSRLTPPGGHSNAIPQTRLLLSFWQLQEPISRELRDLGLDLTPRDLGLDLTPSDLGLDLTPRDLGLDLTPRDLGLDLTPRDLGLDLTPRDLGLDLTPRQTSRTGPRRLFGRT
ncbi:unnamed protein product [Merluccius merluccius]